MAKRSICHRASAPFVFGRWILKKKSWGGNFMAEPTTPPRITGADGRSCRFEAILFAATRTQDR